MESLLALQVKEVSHLRSRENELKPLIWRYSPVGEGIVLRLLIGLEAEPGKYDDDRLVSLTATYPDSG